MSVDERVAAGASLGRWTGNAQKMLMRRISESRNVDAPTKQEVASQQVSGKKGGGGNADAMAESGCDEC